MTGAARRVQLYAAGSFFREVSLRAAVRLGSVAVLISALHAAGAAGARAQALHLQHVVVGGGDSIAISSAGEGAPVVIVPGLLGSAFSFRHVTRDLLAQGLRVVVVEPLGTGASARPTRADYSLEAQATRVAEALDAAGIGPAVFVCHAVAGSICYRLALREPGRVHGIVAINAGPDEHAASPGLRRAMRFAPLLRLVGGAGQARSRLVGGLRENSADASWLTQQVLDSYTRPYADTDHMLNVLRAMSSAREPEALAPRLPHLTVPVRLLVGEAGLGGVTGADEIAKLKVIPDFTAYRVAGAGQYIQEEKPDAVLGAVLLLHRQAERGQR